MDYTPKQMEYIDSVEGKAHASAVRIIGELEAEIESVKASNLVFVPAISDDMLETYLAEIEQRDAESDAWRKVAYAFEHRIKELEGLLNRIHTCAKDIVADDDEDINLKAEWVIEVIEQALKGE